GLCDFIDPRLMNIGADHIGADLRKSLCDHAAEPASRPGDAIFVTASVANLGKSLSAFSRKTPSAVLLLRDWVASAASLACVTAAGQYGQSVPSRMRCGSATSARAAIGPGPAACAVS